MTWVPIFDSTGSQFPTAPAACWADGFRAVAGYVNPNSWKSFTLALRAKWLTAAHPYGFAPMYEVTGTEPATNPTSGSAHALAARKGARALGVPDSVSIAYAMDTNVSMTQVKGPIARYFELVGRYDTAKPIAYIENDGAAWLYEQGLIAGGFIPAAYSWNNPPVLITPANAGPSVLWTQEHNGRKVHGGTVDVGHILTSAPIWWPSTAAGSGQTTGDDVQLTDTLADGTTVGQALTTILTRSANLGPWEKNALDALAAAVASLDAKVAAIHTGGVDMDALSTAVADKLAARLQS